MIHYLISPALQGPLKTQSQGEVIFVAHASSLTAQSQYFQEVIIVRELIASEYSESPYSSFRFILSICIPPYSNAPKGSASHGGTPGLVEIPQHDAKFKDSKSS
jgi:hypothetical protein